MNEKNEINFEYGWPQFPDSCLTEAAAAIRVYMDHILIQIYHMHRRSNYLHFGLVGCTVLIYLKSFPNYFMFDKTIRMNKRLLSIVKSFNRLFTIYFMVLVLTPCSDIHASNVSYSRHMTSSPSQDDNNPHEKTNDFCTPFCACNCGGVEIFSPAEAKLSFKKTTGYAKDIILSFSHPTSWRSDYLDRLFRPPRV